MATCEEAQGVACARGVSRSDMARHAFFFKKKCAPVAVAKADDGARALEQQRDPAERVGAKAEGLKHGGDPGALHLVVRRGKVEGCHAARWLHVAGSGAWQPGRTCEAEGGGERSSAHAGAPDPSSAQHGLQE